METAYQRFEAGLDAYLQRCMRHPSFIGMFSLFIGIPLFTFILLLLIAGVLCIPLILLLQWQPI